ncbi:MAG: outer membrane lipoprotein carrier protein LolA [Planctomycetes bacterium]|nr:outer membrane lipoprotein carrier protein LolA [Planctomycetota bacterium]
MKKRLFLLVPFLFALGVSTAAIADEKAKAEEKPRNDEKAKAEEKPKNDEKLAAIEKELSKVWDKLKSMTADMEMNVAMAGTSTKMKGTVEFVNKPDKELFRMEMTMETDFGGQKMEGTSTTVYDGEFVYMVTDMMGQKTAIKQKPGAIAQSPAGKRMFKSLMENNELKVLPSEKVDGKDAFVIEAVPKGTGPQPVARMKLFLVKENGIMVKMLGYDSAGSEFMTTVYSNIKINPKIDESRFVFKAPDGVQVMDMTNRP